MTGIQNSVLWTWNMCGQHLSCTAHANCLRKCRNQDLTVLTFGFVWIMMILEKSQFEQGAWQCAPGQWTTLFLIYFNGQHFAKKTMQCSNGREQVMDEFCSGQSGWNVSQSDITKWLKCITKWFRCITKWLRWITKWLRCITKWLKCIWCTGMDYALVLVLIPFLFFVCFCFSFSLCFIEGHELFGSLYMNL